MFDVVPQAWDAFWNIPHIRLYLTIGWIVYLVGLGVWIVLQKREPVATISWLVSLAALPYIGFFVYHVFGPQKIRRHRLRRARARVGLPSEAPETNANTTATSVNSTRTAASNGPTACDIFCSS